jgi:hypothetical protein
MSDKVGVALVKYACPICGQVKDDLTAIAINKKLTKDDARKVEAMHDQVVGISDTPCKECQSYIDQGAFFVIGCDADKTDDMSNPYRSGHLVGIKKTSEFYQHLPDEYKKRDAVFMDYREMRQLGMINY